MSNLQKRKLRQQKGALTSALQGAGTWPKERLIPKNIAMIIVATATVKST